MWFWRCLPIVIRLVACGMSIYQIPTRCFNTTQKQATRCSLLYQYGTSPVTGKGSDMYPLLLLLLHFMWLSCHGYIMQHSWSFIVGLKCSLIFVYFTLKKNFMVLYNFVFRLYYILFCASLIISNSLQWICSKLYGCMSQ